MMAFSTTAISTERMVIGSGTVITCGAYLELNEYQQQNAFSWALGYISAINMYAVKGPDILAGTDAGGIRGAVKFYCQKNPLERFASGVESIVIDLSSRAKK